MDRRGARGTRSWHSHCLLWSFVLCAHRLRRASEPNRAQKERTSTHVFIAQLRSAGMIDDPRRRRLLCSAYKQQRLRSTNRNYSQCFGQPLAQWFAQRMRRNLLRAKIEPNSQKIRDFRLPLSHQFRVWFGVAENWSDCAIVPIVGVCKTVYTHDDSH